MIPSRISSPPPRRLLACQTSQPSFGGLWTHYRQIGPLHGGLFLRCFQPVVGSYLHLVVTGRKIVRNLHPAGQERQGAFVLNSGGGRRDVDHRSSSAI